MTALLVWWLGLVSVIVLALALRVWALERRMKGWRADAGGFVRKAQQ